MKLLHSALCGVLNGLRPCERSRACPDCSRPKGVACPGLEPCIGRQQQTAKKKPYRAPGGPWGTEPPFPPIPPDYS